MDGRSNTNVIVGVTTPECAEKLDSPAFKGAQRHAGGNVLSVATIPKEGFPLSFDSCARAYFYRFNTSVNNPSSHTDNLDHIALTGWESELMSVKVRMTNGFDFPIKVFWHEESHVPKSQGIVAPGKSYTVSTYLGHVFAAYNMSKDAIEDDEEDEDEEAEDGEEPPEGSVKRKGVGNLVDFMVVDGSSYTWSPVNRIETCEVGIQAKSFVEGELSCEDMHMRLIEFTHNVWYHKRLGLNYVQPQMVRRVTDSGFEKRKLPPATYKWLKEWYDEQKLIQEVGEGPVGPCMNQHIAPSRITHLPGNLKDKLSRELRDILEGWYGGELEMTSIYGIRKYQNGSVLRMHVDTVNTHVVSSIINVDQGIDEVWPLIILDHDDNEHTVLMEPGDMLLYESAKLLHGRPDPFKGTHYDNIFVHYKPTSGWDYSWV